MQEICDNVYIASCDKDGGIYRYSMDNKGKLTLQDKTHSDRVMYMALMNNLLYAVLMEPFAETKYSGLVCYTISANGSLDGGDNIISTKGEEACHLTVSIPENEVYCANYISGNVFKSDGTVVKHNGNGPHRNRQDSPHTHCTTFTPDRRYLCVVDLGIDKIIVYDKALKPVSQCCLLSGSGPRHLVFSPDGKTAFCINELSNTVSVLDYSEGVLIYVDSFAALPEDYKDESTAAAIRISTDGKYLYTSNRGHDSISCFEVHKNRLNLIDIVPCGGKSPRDFNISPDGKWLVCTNESSDNITIFSIKENGKLEKTNTVEKLKSPLCVVFG